MKKLTFLSLFLVCLGCQPSIVAKKVETKTDSFIANKEFSNYAAVDLNAEIYITDAENVDNPILEATDEIKKIDVAVASLFDEKLKLLDSFVLKKTTPATKGQVSKFKLPFSGMNAGKVKFRMNFSGNNGDIFYENESEITLKAKSLYKAVITLEQTSIKKDTDGKIKPKAKVSIEEIKEDSYVKNQIIVGTTLKEENIKKNLEKEGLKITELKKLGIDSYVISFSEPSTSEALIIASKDVRFDYVETNGIVKAIGF